MASVVEENGWAVVGVSPGGVNRIEKAKFDKGMFGHGGATE